MDASKGRPKMTAGLDLGDKYSRLWLIDSQSGEVIEEGLLCAPPRKLQTTLLLRAPSAHSDRGWNPLALGKQGAGGVWPRGTGGQRPQAEAHLLKQA
jgi:hypothetical protein